MPAAATSPHYASQTLAGTITNNTCTYRIECAAVPTSTSVTYQSTFSSSAFTGTFTTTNTQIINKTSQQPGTGSVAITVNRTSPSSTAEDAGDIKWYLNGGLLNTQAISVGVSISYTYTVTGVGNNDIVLVTIDEG